MYFKVSGRHNPTTNQPGWYYRLVESYRNSDGRVCHRTMLNVGFLEGLASEQMNLIQKRLTGRAENQDQKLFEFPVSDDPVVNQYVEAYYTNCDFKCRITCPELIQRFFTLSSSYIYLNLKSSLKS